VFSFTEGLPLLLFDTLTPIAERSYIGEMHGSDFKPTEHFLGDVIDNALGATKHATGSAHRRFFEICRATMTVYFARHDPASVKHSDLMTLFCMNMWRAAVESLERELFPIET